MENNAKTIRLTVSQEDIANARLNLMECPLALALDRKFGVDNATVTRHDAWINDRFLAWDLSWPAAQFVARFDAGQSVEPAVFVLTPSERWSGHHARPMMESKMADTDYNAIRAQIVALCKSPLVLGKPVPEAGYTPKRNGSKNGQSVTLRYSTSFEIAGYKGTYTGPVDGKSYYGTSTFQPRGSIDIGGGWCARPTGEPSPTLGDVLSSLLQDAQCGSETFEDFCDNLGYDKDSRKAEAIWRECQSCLGAMVRAFGDDLGKATELAYQL
jgi:hypothetical protein